MLSCEFDVIVIGGGLPGCFAARNLTRYADAEAGKPLKIALLEKSDDVCTGMSRANTAIVYSGCDTKPGTMKTAMCVRAAKGFPALCGELGVRYSQCGSLMVCLGERGAGVLRKKLAAGTENGVSGMRLLSREETLEMEPGITGKVQSGLFVPATGTVMPWELCIAAAENAASNGAEIRLNTEVVDVARADGGGFIVTARIRKARAYGSLRIEPAPGGENARNAVFTQERDHGQTVKLRARAIVNCSGMSSDKLHGMVEEPMVRIVPTAGDYYVLDTKASGHINHVIFHEPEEKGKGLTLVPTVDGNVLAGPTERPINGDVAGYETGREGLELLRSLIGEVAPSLSLDHVIRSFGAVRPNPFVLAVESGERIVDSRGGVETPFSIPHGYRLSDRSVSDFCIVESADGALVSLIGIKTPGLTCADELGAYAAAKVAGTLGAAQNPRFDPHRTAPARLSELSFEDRAALIRQNPDYGKIVCRCRGVSEGEILDAIRRFPAAVTADGVKRRTGAGSGRCQGGFCGQSVAEFLARRSF